jgi:ABC-type branched-subunit amino acid transport system substrate-binding protein
VRRHLLVLLVALVALASACGSSVLTERAAGTEGKAGSTQVHVGTGTDGSVTVDGVPTAGSDATVGSSGPTQPGAVAASATSGTAYKMGVPGFTQGITATSIKIGIPVIANAEAAAGLLGAANIRPGDNGVETRALVADINAHGGINGRKIDAQFFAVDFGNPSSVEAHALEACNHFADDLKVFAILMVINPPVSFTSCAAHKGVVLLNGSLNPLDDALIASSQPWYYSPTLLSQSRIWAPLLDSVGARGVVKKGDKVAVFVLDQVPFPGVADNVVIPALEARGYQVAAVERVSSEASIQNAVLRFRQSGATHVLFVQASGIADLLFMRQAEAQKYRPTYLLSSYDVPGYLLEGNVAPEQIAGIQGIGWEALADVAPTREPLSAQEQRCFQILTKGGEPQSMRQDFLTAEFMCDLVWSFEAIARAAGPDLSTVSFRDGYHSLGTTYRPVTVAAVDFSKRIDGVSAFRPMGYVTSCKCLQYLGPLQPLP